MCDTFYLPTPDRVYFGKNSDRKSAEPQALIIVPPREASGSVHVGSRDCALKDAGHAMALSCPTWMAGAEMGLNAAGVAIGNEAVFSRFKAAKDGVLGMDFLRAALAAASTAQEALEALVELTERFDQGGNGSFKGTLVYNNSYMIAGPDGAYVLETAAKRWAWRQLHGPSAISNSYTIRDDYKRVDPATRKAIAVVNERMACLDEADAGRVSEKESWKAYVEDRFMSRFSAGDARRRAVSGLLGAAAEAGSRAAALAVLRAHAAPDPEKPSRPRNVCNHDFDVVGSPTTSSMLVEYAPGGRTVLWFTGASYACSNVFKPVLLEDGRFRPLWVDYDYAEGTVAGGDYWHARREKARRVRRNPKAADAVASSLAETQSRLFDMVDGLAASSGPEEFAKAAERVGAIVAEWDARTI
jgi:secernin